MTWLHVHNQELTVDVGSVNKKTDTGKYQVGDIIQKVATGTSYDANMLVPIYDAYKASVLSVGCTASILRDAIHSRLTRDNLIGQVAAVTLDENAP